MHRMSVPDENLIIDCPVLSDAAPVVVGVLVAVALGCICTAFTVVRF